MNNDKARTMAESLARTKDAKNWIVWTEIPLGSVLWGANSRADVLAIRKSFSDPCFSIYEIKTSRADYQHDLFTGKYLKYFNHCHAFYFAVPAGMIAREEVPTKCGLIVLGDKGWRCMKSPSFNAEFKPSTELMLKLLMKDYEKHWEEWTQYDRLKGLEYKSLKEASAKFGLSLSIDLANSSELIETSKKMLAEINEALGANHQYISSAISNLEYQTRKALNIYKRQLQIEQIGSIVNMLASAYPDSLERVSERLHQVADQIKEED